MARILAENLKERQKGHHVTTEEWNAIVRFLKSKVQLGQGSLADGFSAQTARRKVRARVVHVQTTELIPPFSLFSGTNETPSVFDEPMLLRARKIGITETGPHGLLLTNGSLQIEANTQGAAKIVNYGDVIKLVFTGTTPKIGHFVGPEIDGYRVTTDQEYGLVVVGLVDDDSDDKVECIRSHEPVAIVGKVTSQISARSGDTLGFGIIDIKYRDTITDDLKDGKDPGVQTTPWSHTIFHIGSSIIAVDEIVRAVYVMGIGLVVDGSGAGGTTLPECTDPGQMLYCDEPGDYVLTDPPTGDDGYFYNPETETMQPGPVPFPAQLWWSEAGAGAEIRNATLVPGSSQTVLASGEDVTKTLASEAFNKRVYWGNDTDAKIRGVDFDGENKSDIVNLAAGSSPIHSLEFFPSNDFLYWFRGNRITRAEAITITNLGENVSPALSQVGGTSGFLTLAKFDGVDSIFYSRFFGTSGTISRVKLDSTPTDFSPVVLRTTGGSKVILAMTINEPTNEIFWFETGTGDIDLKRGTLAASSITGVTTPVAGLVSGSNFEIKIDGINQKIIFTGKLSTGEEGILSCNFDGSDIRLLHSLTGTNRATGIELIADTVIAAIEAVTPVTDQLKIDVETNRGLILLMS